MNSIEEITVWVSSKLQPKHRFDVELIARIESSAWNLRATYIERQFNKTEKFLPSTIQNLGVIEMEKVDAAEYCGFEDGCTIWRSKREIPRPIQVYRQDKFEFVGSPNSVNRFTLANGFQFANLNSQSFNSLTPYYLYRDDRLYASVEYLRVRGAFEDPREAAKFNTCYDADCSVSTNSYMPADWIESIRMELIKEFSPYIEQGVKDISAAGNEV